MTKENSPICAIPMPTRIDVRRSLPATNEPNEQVTTFRNVSLRQLNDPLGIDGGYYDDYNSYYQPNYVSNYGYGSYQPTYYTFGYPPTYTYYEPATYYGYNQYADYGIPYDAFSGSLPYNDVVEIYSGGLAGELIQRALGMGYYQGLLEGQQARRRGWGDRYFYDPYVYDQAMYDPYSTSIGDSRRYFSEGYEMGYRDALRGRDEFGLSRGGDVDLVSLLLGSVLSLRG